MRDYDELIANLRNCAKVNSLSLYKRDLMKQAADAIDELAGFIQEAERDRDEYRERLDKANDAIEELKQNIEQYKLYLQDAINDLRSAHEKEQKWISVEERLPETRSSILGQKSNKVIVAFRFDDGTQGTDTAHTLNGDWVFEDRIVVVNRTVTHWMPLPEPPKED